MTRRSLVVLFSLLASLGLVATPGAAQDQTNDTSRKLRAAVTVEGIREHQAALQEIATANGNTRASGTPGYDASVDYVVPKLRAAGYDVTVQRFDFNFFQQLAPAEFEQVSPNPTVYELNVDFSVMDYSGSGNPSATITPVDLLLPPTGGSTSGCEAGDFAEFPAGNIALVQRGTCTFQLKAENAQAAGASGVIVFNEGNAPDRVELLFGTLGEPTVTIPVIGISFALGNDLNTLAQSGPVTVRIETTTISEVRPTENVLAETRRGREGSVVMVGAHLDSVLEGPGINDNGSGSGTILEIAEQLAGVRPRNQIRFALWGAEENGLVGSDFYVSSLRPGQQRDIALYLNFDMVGSPNFVRFVYDGDGSANPGLEGPRGSARIERLFLRYFARRGLPTEPTAFDGRSDYGPFIAVGIPAGGLFTGAEDIKTPEQAAIYGGTAGIALDPCYHQACDTVANSSDTALDQMSDAAAHAVITFAQSTDLFDERDDDNGD